MVILVALLLKPMEMIENGKFELVVLSYQKDRTLQAIVHACKDEMIKGHKIYILPT